MSVGVISFPVEYKIHINESTALKQKIWALRQSCLVKSLKMAIGSTTGTGTENSPGFRARSAAARKENLKSLFISSFETLNGKFLFNFKIVLHTLFAKKSNFFSFPSTPKRQCILCGDFS